MTVILVCTAALLASPAARAGDVHQAAEEKFRAGREAMNRGDCPAAIALFEASNDLEPGRGKGLNIAICEEKLGRLVAAARRFRELLPQFPAGDDRRPIVQEHLASLGKRVPLLTVRLSAGAPEGAAVTLDGRALDVASPAEVPVDPGAHTLVVSCAGRADARREVTVEEGSRVSMTVEPGPPVGGAAPRPGAPPDGGRLTAAYALGAVGVVGLGAGAVTGGLAVSLHDSTESRCPTHRGCAPEVLSDASLGQAMSVISTVSLAAGAAAAGVGVYLFLTSKPVRSAAPAVGVFLAPSGVTVTGDF